MPNIKVILFDIDGVLIRPPYYFSKELKLKGYVNAQKSLDAYYFSNEHIQSLEGKADSQQVIVPYLQSFHWEYSAAEYLQQQFEFERKYLDREMMDIISQLRSKGMKCCIAADQEKHRAHYLLHSLNFDTAFDDHFISYIIGGRKCSTLFWDRVIEKLNDKDHIRPDEIIFFDDVRANFDMALGYGIKAFLFKSVKKFKKCIVALDP